MILEKYSMGLGDRFAKAGEAQLQAIMQAHSHGIHIAPVWNKSHREHAITNTEPMDVMGDLDDLGAEEAPAMDLKEEAKKRANK